MQPPDDNALLRQFSEDQSDEAFAALVTRHINLVYSVALRQTGNPHNAEEVTQAVFIILAKKASRLRHDRALSSWLFQTTRLTANNFIRGELRRYRREEKAYMQSRFDQSAEGIWPKIAPYLESAVAALGKADRQAILLRFYEGRTLRDVGLALDASEDAAEKRVTRALDKLRKFFLKHGVNSTPAVIAGVLSTNSVQAVPVALAKSVAAVAVAKGATASASTLTLLKTTLKIMASTKLKIGIISALVAAAAATTAVVTVKHFSNAHGSVEVSIMNHSNHTLSNLSVNSDHFGVVGIPLPPGATVRLLYPVDSRGWLYFEANGRKIESRGTNYTDYVTFASRRPMSFDIGTDLKVTALGGK